MPNEAYLALVGHNSETIEDLLNRPFIFEGLPPPSFEKCSGCNCSDCKKPQWGESPLRKLSSAGWMLFRWLKSRM